MKKKLAGLYDPYLDVLGGGEKHILSILKVLEDFEYSIHIFWNKNLQSDFVTKFNLSFKSDLHFAPNIFSQKISSFQKLKLLKNYDYFFYVTDGSYFFSSSKKTFIYCMVPQKNLYKMDFSNRLKTRNVHFITNSVFTKKNLQSWGINSEIIYPYIDETFLSKTIDLSQKEKIILTVGRFFTHLHAKKHNRIIELFKKIKPQLPNYKLILAGGLKKEDKEYFERLKKIIGGDSSIQLQANLSFNELFELYKKSQLYWHFAGYGIDENKHPELVEHFGITPLEAMASGCVTFVYNAGGPKELIKDGYNGFLFNSEEELLKKTLKTITDQQLQTTIQKNAKNYVKKGFSYEAFKKNVIEILDI